MTDQQPPDNNHDIDSACTALGAGGVVLHATEGVWGFACDPFAQSAVDRIIEIKGRAAEKGLILIGAAAEVFAGQLEHIKEAHRKEVLASWPGPHTWILPDDHYPAVIRGFRDTLACRVPGHAQARALCQAFGGTLVSTSANISGAPAVTTEAQARRRFEDRVDFVLPGAVNDPGRASTIHGPQGEILR